MVRSDRRIFHCRRVRERRHSGIPLRMAAARLCRLRAAYAHASALGRMLDRPDDLLKIPRDVREARFLHRACEISLSSRIAPERARGNSAQFSCRYSAIISRTTQLALQRSRQIWQLPTPSSSRRRPSLVAGQEAQFRTQVGSISRHSAVFFAGSLFTAGAGYLFKIYVARVLGADGLGIYALGMTHCRFSRSAQWPGPAAIGDALCRRVFRYRAMAALAFFPRPQRRFCCSWLMSSLRL